MTHTIALIGHPVAHSVSPAMQQAALDALGIDARYEAWDTPPEHLPAAFERLRAGGVLGANVTVPHKVAALGLVDQIDGLAERTGAVNTVVHRQGSLFGTNTDVEGVARALREAGVRLRGAEVVLLGAGGAARAVLVAMQQAGVARLTVANRTIERARALAALPLDGEMTVEACLLEPGDERLRRVVRDAALIVQATTLGMRHGPAEAQTPMPREWFVPGQAAFDLVYAPERTPFLAAAEAAGARPVGGLAMLVYQGAASFRLWTGQEAPVDVMFATARSALAER